MAPQTYYHTPDGEPPNGGLPPRYNRFAPVDLQEQAQAQEQEQEQAQFGQQLLIEGPPMLPVPPLPPLPPSPPLPPHRSPFLPVPYIPPPPFIGDDGKLTTPPVPTRVPVLVPVSALAPAPALGFLIPPAPVTATVPVSAPEPQPDPQPIPAPVHYTWLRPRTVQGSNWSFGATVPALPTTTVAAAAGLAGPAVPAVPVMTGPGVPVILTVPSPAATEDQDSGAKKDKKKKKEKKKPIPPRRLFCHASQVPQHALLKVHRIDRPADAEPLWSIDHDPTTKFNFSQHFVDPNLTVGMLVDMLDFESEDEDDEDDNEDEDGDEDEDEDEEEEDGFAVLVHPRGNGLWVRGMMLKQSDPRTLREVGLDLPPVPKWDAKRGRSYLAREPIWIVGP